MKPHDAAAKGRFTAAALADQRKALAWQEVKRNSIEHDLTPRSTPSIRSHEILGRQECFRMRSGCATKSERSTRATHMLAAMPAPDDVAFTKGRFWRKYSLTLVGCE